MTKTPASRQREPRRETVGTSAKGRIRSAYLPPPKRLQTRCDRDCLAFFSSAGNDILDRRCTSRGLLRQQSPRTVRRHGRVSGPVACPTAKPLQTSGPTADRVQRFRYVFRRDDVSRD